MSSPGQKPTPQDNPLSAFNDELDKMLQDGATPAAPQPQNPVTTMPSQQMSAAASTPEEDPLGPSAEDAAAAPAPAVEKPKDGIIKRSISAVGNTLAGLGAGLLRTPGQLAGGVADAAVDATNAIFDHTLLPVGQWLDKGPERFPGQKAIAASIINDAPLRGGYADMLSARKYLGGIGYSSVNQGTAQIGSLVLGAMGLSEIRLAGGLAKFTNAGKTATTVAKMADVGVQAGIAGGILMDPHAERVSTMMSNLGVHTEFTDWLGNNDPKQESSLEGRFKNAVENAGLGAATEGVFLGGKYLWALAKGGPEAAASAKEAAANAMKEIVPEGTIPKTEPVTAVTPEGKVTLDGEEAVAFPGGKTQYDDLVNSAKDPLPEGEAAAAPASKPSDPMPPLNDPANVGPLLRQMAIDLHDTPHVVKPDEQMYARAADIAKEIGVNPNDLMIAAEQVAGKMTDIDSAVTAMRGAWHKIVNDVSPWAAKGIDAVGEEEIPQLKQSIHNAITYSGYFANVRSQSGRLLRSLQLPDLEGYLKTGAEKPTLGEFAGEPLKPLPQTRQELGDWLEMFNDAKNNPALLQDFLQGVQTVPSAFKYLRTSLANWFTASALSGLPSLTMNTVGPAIIGVLHTTEKTLGGAAAAILERDPERRAELVRTSAMAARAYVQTMGDIPNVLKYATQAFLSNRSILGGGGTVNDIVSNMGPITPAMIRSAQGADAPVWTYALGNAVNFLPRQFQRLNAGLDEFAKRLSYNGEVRLQAMLDGAKEGLSGDAMKSYVKQAMQNSIEQDGMHIGAAASEDLLRSAERTTFTGSLAGNDYHPIVGKFVSAVNSMRKEIPEFRYIAPVFNVPANSVGESMRRIPGLNLLLGETRDELLGSMGSVRQADAYGRTLMGGMFMMWAYGMARNGQLTGAGPQDPRDRQIWALDHEPYSVKVGDHWVSYARYDLPGSLLAIPATLYDKTVSRNSDQDWTMAMIGGAGAMAQYFKDKAALQGVSQMMDFGANPSSDLNYFERTVGNTAARMAVPNFVTQLGRNVMDPQKRIKASIGDYIADALPWQSQELDPMRNVLGEPQFKPNQTLLENGLPIVIASTKPHDAVIQELDRLYQSTGYGGGVTTPAEISGGSTAGGFFDPRDVKLENGRSLYDAVISARTKPSEDLDATSVRGRLAELFASEEYQTATEGDATSMYDSDGNLSKAALVKQVYSDYNKEAIRQVAAESPIARRYLAVSSAKRINGDRLRPYSAQRLVDQPELLTALGINIQDFEDKLQ